ncbi:transglutaminase family protein [Chloroflexota bacterium]
MSSLDIYLMSNGAIDSDNPVIRDKARMVIEGADSPTAHAVALFYAVRDGIRYNPYVTVDDPEQYKASRVLQVGEGYCVQKAVLLCALARAVGIPARLGLADIKNYHMPPKLLDKLGTNHIIFHGYAVL